ncbi:tetratricopeptide repeat protein, partial [Myxococcota bacterium]|nr:tetratricopeptide repeat protein [Myxococcota bacterium]
LAHVAILAGCRADVRRDVIRSAGPSADVARAVAERVAEASEPAPPPWIDAASREGGDALAFVGRAESASLDAAKAAAVRDLYASISSFVAVDVESEELDVVEERTGASPSSVARSSQRLSVASSASLREVAPDAHYWERVVRGASSAGAAHRYFVHAWVPRGEITRARVARQASREQKIGRKSVVVVPFEYFAERSKIENMGGNSGLDARGALLTSALDAELTDLLAKRGKLHVQDPAIVRSLMPGDRRSELGLVERMQDTLLPDVVVTGAVKREGARVGVTAVAWDAREGRALGVHTRRGTLDELVAIQGELATALAEDVARPASEPPAPGAPQARATDGPPRIATDEHLRRTGRDAPARIRALFGGGTGATDVHVRVVRSPTEPQVVEAHEAHVEAYRLFQRGDLDGALAKSRRAVTLRPDVSTYFLRLGRILERMGRYARLPATEAVLAQTLDDVRLCTARARARATEAQAFLRARAEALAAKPSATATPGAPWWTDTTSMLDPLLDAACKSSIFTDGVAARTSMLGRHGRGPQVESAAEAYVEARLLAHGTGDLRDVLTASLALADLALRTDRLDHAHSLLLDVEARALQTNDLHFLSLARASLGAVLRQAGDLPRARAVLLDALAARAVLAEKPYLLELYNALGGLAVELGRFAEAEGWYVKARRIADDLGNDYLKAVLANNVAVLEHGQGKTTAALAHAEEAFERLTDLGEAEGRVASGLNVALFRHRGGDLTGAHAALDASAAIVTETAQEGRLAELASKKGALAAARGDHDEALYELAVAYFLHRGLGRPVQVARVQNDLLATELAALGDDPDRATLACLKRTYWDLGAPVFVTPRDRGRMHTLETLPLDALDDHDLATALNAATVSALDRWLPPRQRLVVRQAPRTLVDHRVIRVVPGVVDIEVDAEVAETRTTDDVTRPSRVQVDEPTSKPAPPTQQRETVQQGTATGGGVGEVVIVSKDEDRRRPSKVPVSKDAAEDLRPEEKPAEYERILGAFVADAGVFVWLDPALAGALRPSAIANARTMLTAAAKRFEARGQQRLFAIALVNLAAAEWTARDVVDAYTHLRAAHDVFGALGDVEGLAHTHEWLGVLLRDSGDGAKASAHLTEAHALFTKLEDDASAERVLAWATEG